MVELLSSVVLSRDNGSKAQLYKLIYENGVLKDKVLVNTSTYKPHEYEINAAKKKAEEEKKKEEEEKKKEEEKKAEEEKAKTDSKKADPASGVKQNNNTDEEEGIKG